MRIVGIFGNLAVQIVLWTRVARCVAGVHATNMRRLRLGSRLRCSSRTAADARFAGRRSTSAPFRRTSSLLNLRNPSTQLLFLNGVEAATAAVALVHNLVLNATAVLQRYRAFYERAGDVNIGGIEQLDAAADLRILDRDEATLSGGQWRLCNADGRWAFGLSRDDEKRRSEKRDDYRRLHFCSE